jgi:arylsulfatase A-like enzyme
VRLTFALSRVTDEQCRDAIECQVRALFAQVGDGSTSCVQQLFKEGYKFMANEANRIRRERLDKIPEDLARCKERGGRRCVDPIAPPLTDTCAGKTTPTDGAICVCDAADSIANRLLLTPATCIPQAPEPCPTTTVSGTPKPNFVIILSDDQRWDTVDATHQSPNRPGYVMPNVKSELIDSGVTFSEGHVTTALCCPSRTSILTGQYSHNTGVHDNSPPDGGAEIFDDHCTIARWLKAQNYTTGFIGKYLNGYASLAPCIPPGYDDWFVQVQVKFFDYDVNHNGVIEHFDSADADYSGDVMTQHAVDFIHARGVDGKRFFLHVSQKAPHGPATAAPRHLGLFAGIAPFRPPNYAEPDVTDKPAWVQALTWTTNNQNSTDNFRIKQLESLQAVDEGVAAIMQALRDIGQDDNTLVIYTADNGFSWGSHRWRPKQCPYEECIRVPLVMRYPDLAGTVPRTDSRFVLNVDFAATIADLAGVQPPEPRERRQRGAARQHADELADRHAERALERADPRQRAREGRVQRRDVEVRRVRDRRDGALQPRHDRSALERHERSGERCAEGDDGRPPASAPVGVAGGRDCTVRATELAPEEQCGTSGSYSSSSAASPCWPGGAAAGRPRPVARSPPG